ncbi:MAG: hypothetical protein M1829_005087 [Trizodia sp. TS-e1964]|nr:MAG: hypothetical protein M1829_005087 [Trizodia sp. TS-e1964]
MPPSSSTPSKEVTDALQKLNAALRHHTKASCSSLAARHVAEQIDALYWRQASSNSLTVSGDNDVLSSHTDLRVPGAAARLPDEWEDEEEGSAGERDD